MNRFFIALQAKYQAEIEESLAVLDLYLNKSVGVGEHPDVLSVLDEYTSRLESARSKLEVLSQIFQNQAQNQEEVTPTEPVAQ
jgi:uncharacterized protein (DUF342 family)